MIGEDKSVIVIGASFAGLATARFIEDGQVEILERQKELGRTQRSTCCTSVKWMERLNCQSAVLKTFNHITLHSSDENSARMKLPETFCTFDYKVFCNTLAGKLENAHVLTGKRVLGLDADSGIVLTGDGPLSGKIIVDASGWPSVKAWGSLQGITKPAFGLEVETSFDGDSTSFHIYYGKRFIEKGYGWVFPIGKGRARVGVGGYHSFKPGEALDHFLGVLGMHRDGLKPHGGYLPLFGLSNPVRGKVFVVGDACGQVLPLSGEGIRKAFEYAELCGRTISKVLRDELTLEEALKEYTGKVLKAKRFYDNLSFIQTLAVHCPDWARNRVIKALSKLEDDSTEALLQRYVNGNITTPKTRILKTLLGGIYKGAL